MDANRSTQPIDQRSNSDETQKVVRSGMHAYNKMLLPPKAAEPPVSTSKTLADESMNIICCAGSIGRGNSSIIVHCSLQRLLRSGRHAYNKMLLPPPK